MLECFGWDRYVYHRLGRYGRIDKLGQICWGAWVILRWIIGGSDTGNVQAGKGTVRWIVGAGILG